ncbi:growth-regulated protein homolog gamma-like isoform X2 [Lynx rufus]|uniref:growth-regulated protein homolog gamma-like isoform X2 n=1 Tax=Lynx rufus TaxID=61384 RepID=UPI001F127D35|nr:growth-regulated protein homolog gamma-like isoform X2 [Lynx rufus]
MARTAPRAPRLLGAALLLLLLVPAARRAAGEARSPRGDGVRVRVRVRVRVGVGCAPRGRPLTRPALPAGEPVVTELRCQCLQTVQGIHPKNIQSVKVTQSGPHCAHTEVIATLKNGHEACLNPEAPMVKRVIEKMLSNQSL